jgi:hypothetical protein
MKQNIQVLNHNAQGHIDIEDEIERQKNGLFTFIVRVAEKKIVDIVFLSYADYQAFKEPSVPHSD